MRCGRLAAYFGVALAVSCILTLSLVLLISQNLRPACIIPSPAVVFLEYRTYSGSTEDRQAAIAILDEGHLSSTLLAELHVA